MEKSCIWNFNYVENENRLPKSWEEFCEIFPGIDVNLLPDLSTSEAVHALIKLIWLRNCYNGDWKPSYEENNGYFFIDFMNKDTVLGFAYTSASILYFENREIRDEFLRNFRPLIEKLKPLYGIKKGGEE